MYVLRFENLQLYLRLGLKLKNSSWIRIQSTTMAKTYVEFNAQKRIEQKKKRQSGKSIVQFNEQCCMR